MPIADREADVIARLASWAERHPLVRALLLTSSRANDRAPRDIFSDYDVIVVVSDLPPFVDDDTWLADFDEPLVRFRDTQQLQGIPTHHRLVLYADRTKIDYTIWPVALLRQIRDTPRLPDGLDWGYRVLLDKDGLAVGLPAPTSTAYIPSRPTEREYQALVEEFWWETIYVAKNLWRDELLHAKYNLEIVMKHDLLVRMLEWRIEIDHNWSWKPGVVGRGMKPHLPPAIWSDLERTYVGLGIAENWQALFATTALFRNVASAVGASLGYTYPHDLDARVTAYLEEVRSLPR
jgi:aminoglycoside 6-adenylyltransferase